MKTIFSLFLSILYVRITCVVEAAEYISTFAGTGAASNTGTGAATSATTQNPMGIWGDSQNQFIYFASFQNCFRKVSLSTMIISAVAGTCSTTNVCGQTDENGIFHFLFSFVLNLKRVTYDY